MRFSILVLLLAFAFCSEFNDLVCSGFVELSPEFKDFDFSTIEIHLYRLDGQLVEKSQCASNGFYIIPIYDLKDYLLKVVSKGQVLQFLPDKVDLRFNSKSFDQAKQFCDTMINFKWSGFQLSDRISVFNNNFDNLDQGSLQGLTVELLSQTQSGVIQTTISGSRGLYTFNNIQPGKYIIRLSDKAGGHRVQHSEIRCSVTQFEGKECNGVLSVYGFDVQGQIKNENEPLSRFKVFLMAHPGNELKHIEGCQRKGVYYCETETNEQGQFEFLGVPMGLYYVKFEVHVDSIEIEPDQIEIEVVGKPLVLKQQLQVNKLSIRGRVVDSRNIGIADVKIYLDGSYETVSDEEGYYNLEKIKAGTYTLEGQHDHLIFEPLTNLKLNLGLKMVPNLPLTYLHLCGQIDLNIDDSIQFSEQNEFRNLKITIYLENIQEKSEKRTTPVSKENEFKYCFEVRPGKYLVYPVVQEKGRDIVWQPKYVIIIMIEQYDRSRQIELRDIPQLTVNFERKIVISGGNVLFLQGVSAEQLRETSVRLYSTKEPQKVIQEQSLVSVGPLSANFQFSNVLNGQYDVTIVNPIMCFVQSTIPLVITATSASDLQFQHMGYSINYQTLHNIPVTVVPWKTPNNKETFMLTSSQSRLCVQTWDDYTIQVDPCFKADKQSQVYQMNDPKSIYRVAIVKVRVQGHVSLDKIHLKTYKELASKVKIEITSTGKHSRVQDVDVIDVQFKNDQKHLSFQYYVNPDTHLTLKPVLSEDVPELENLLFAPNQLSLSVEQDCIRQSVNFELNSGFVFQGTLDLPVEDLLIQVLNDQQQEIDSMTVSADKFKLGPYVNDQNYTLALLKEGFRFQQQLTTENNIVKANIKVEQLSAILIRIYDTNKKPLPQVNVFISTMSKTNNLRINNQTNDDGVFYSTSFGSGQYLVKAHLKEYMFEPSSNTINRSIDLQSGQKQVIEIIGKKIAFSVFGRIHDFNKEGIQAITVEAFNLPLADENIPKETSVTDKFGNYRIRGLEPNRKYRIRVNQLNQPENAFIQPQSFDLHIAQEDVFNQDFLYFQKPKAFLIQGQLQFEPSFSKQEQDLYSIVSFEVFSETNLETPLSGSAFRRLQFQRYYEFEMLEPQDILLKIVVEKQKEKGEQTIKTKEFTQEIKRIQIIREEKVTAPFTMTKPAPTEYKQSNQQSILVPLFIFAAVVAMLNYDKFTSSQ